MRTEFGTNLPPSVAEASFWPLHFYAKRPYFYETKFKIWCIHVRCGRALQWLRCLLNLVECLHLLSADINQFSSHISNVSFHRDEASLQRLRCLLNLVECLRLISADINQFSSHISNVSSHRDEASLQRFRCVLNLVECIHLISSHTNKFSAHLSTADCR